MLAIKGMQGLGSGLLPGNGISPLIPLLFLSLIFPYSSVAPLLQVGSLLGWSQQPGLKPSQNPALFLVSGTKEAQVLDVSLQKEFSERQSDR